MDLSVLNSVLLFVFSIPPIMHYRIWPASQTPYWLFGILFFLLVLNLLFSLFHQKKFQNLLIVLILGIVVGGISLTSIVDRSKTAPIFGVHDIILQQEAAMRYLLEGKNPYQESYFGTPVEAFHYDELGKPAVNPALYHFVMPPWYLLFPFAFYFLTIPLWGFFDARIALVFCLFGLLVLIYRSFKNKDLGRLAVILTALSPAAFDYFLEGRSDIFALFWLFWSIYLLTKNSYFGSTIMLGLAIGSKQTTWFAVPIYLCYLWLKLKRNWMKLILRLIPLALTLLLLFLPFLLWDRQSFLDSLIFYLNGKSTYSYPISGYGWGMVLYSLNLIRDLHQYYPFIYWQLVAGLPVLLLVTRWMMQKLTTAKIWLGYGLLLMVVWYFSRYFNNSHLAYISSVLVLGVLFHYDEQT